MDKFFPVGDTKIKKVPLECSLALGKNATVLTTKIVEVIVKLNKEGEYQPMFVKTALKDGLSLKNITTVLLDKGCKNCLDSVRKNCGKIIGQKNIKKK